MTFGSHDSKGFGTEAANGTIHDRSQCLLSFSITIDRRIFCYIYSNLSQDYRTIYSTHTLFLTKSGNKIAAIFLYRVSAFTIKLGKH